MTEIHRPIAFKAGKALTACGKVVQMNEVSSKPARQTCLTCKKQKPAQDRVVLKRYGML